MKFVKLVVSEAGHYCYRDASDEEMTILGNFLSTDVGDSASSYLGWALDTSSMTGVSGNITFLEKDGNYILISDLYDEKEDLTELKMTRAQFVELLADWQEKVCKSKPSTVIIKHKNDQFIIETSDE